MNIGKGFKFLKQYGLLVFLRAVSNKLRGKPTMYKVRPEAVQTKHPTKAPSAYSNLSLESRTVGSNILYVEDMDTWRVWCEKDCYVNQVVSSQIVKNGIIMPMKNIPGVISLIGNGGVVDENGNYVAGHLRNLSPANWNDNIENAYPISQDVQYVNETVVYGGFIHNHIGHMIAECLSRMWWHIENPESGYKFVFITPEYISRNEFMDFFTMLGVHEKI